MVRTYVNNDSCFDGISFEYRYFSIWSRKVLFFNYRCFFINDIIFLSSDGSVEKPWSTPDIFLSRVIWISYRSIPIIAAALGKKPIKLLGHRDVVAIYKNEEDIKSIYPDMEKLKKLNYPAVIVTAPGDNVDFVSRNFAPKLGIPEDPVTGSAHCELIPCLLYTSDAADE